VTDGADLLSILNPWAAIGLTEIPRMNATPRRISVMPWGLKPEEGLGLNLKLILLTD
jgi:hypothetical protein